MMIKNNLTNYRLMSLLPEFSKILKKLFIRLVKLAELIIK